MVKPGKLVKPGKRGQDMVHKPDVVLLIGAGASAYMNVPPMKPFLPVLYETFKQGGRQDLVDLARTILGYTQRYPDLETLIIEADSLRRLESSTTSQMLLDLLPKTRGGALRRNVNAQMSRKKALVDDLWRNMLARIRQISVSFIQERAMEVYSPLLALNGKLSLRIFTTNYDPIIENTCESMDIRFTENFVRDANRDFFDTTYAQLGKNRVDIVKLHGSVWWYLIPELGKIERTPYLLGDVSREGKRVERLMIIPSAFKDIYGEPFFGLYLYFLHSMENSNLCVVIGHSLRDEYLTGIIESRLKDAKFRLVVIGPEPKPEDESKAKLRDILAMRNVIHVPFRFEEFYKEIASFMETLATSPEDAISVLKETVKEKKRFQRSRKAILKVTVLPKDVPRGSPIPIQVRYKGELKRAYLAARLLTRGPKVVITAIAPGTQADDKTGMLDGTVIHEATWDLLVPAEVRPGKYTVQVAATETYWEDEQLRRRDVKDRRFGITVT